MADLTIAGLAILAGSGLSLVIGLPLAMRETAQRRKNRRR